jgi:hypothetical protein
MPVNVNALQFLIAFAVALAARREHGYLVARIAKCTCLLPHTTVKGHR